MTLSAYGKYGSAASKLGDAIRSGIVSHAYIIEGDSNIDKIGFARAFCQALTCSEMPGEGCGKCVNCRKIADGNHEDLYVVEPDDTTASKNGTDSIKDAAVEELQVRLKEKPAAGDHNMAIISGGDGISGRYHALMQFLALANAHFNLFEIGCHCSRKIAHSERGNL